MNKDEVFKQLAELKQKEVNASKTEIVRVCIRSIV